MVHFKSLVRFFLLEVDIILIGSIANTPYRWTDRKIEDFFVLKSFIFSNVPAEWSFGALEMLSGMPQIIDITDDVTGHPSELAKKEIPMYGE